MSFPYDNKGLYEQTGRSHDVGKFRVPTLRNIAVTAPYMHDGSIATLDEALDHYVAGGRTANPLKSTGLQPLTLTADERKDLIAFLESLTDREAPRPALERSVEMTREMQAVKTRTKRRNSCLGSPAHSRMPSTAPAWSSPRSPT